MIHVLQKFADRMVNRRLHLLNSRNVVGTDNERKVGQATTKDLASVITEQRDGEQILFSSFFERHHDIFRATTGGDSDGYVVRPRMGNQLALKNQFRTHVIGYRGKIRGFQRKRNSGKGPLARTPQDTVEGPVIGIGGRTSIAEDDEFSAALGLLVNGGGSRGNFLRFLLRNSRTKDGVVSYFHLNRVGHFRHDISGLLRFFAEKGVEKSGVTDIVPQLAVFEKDVHRLP